MNRDQKAAVVDEIAGQIKEAAAIFAVDYRGITVDQVAELRAKLRDADARFRVVKNSLSERAADKAGAEELKPLLEGPTALTLVHGDAALAAKALNDTARSLNILEFKGGLMDGGTLTADDIRSIARLPSREVLHGQLVGTIAAPLSQLVRTLNALVGGLAIQLQAIADQGLVAGEATAQAPASEDSAAEPASEEGAAEAAPEEGADASEVPAEVADEPTEAPADEPAAEAETTSEQETDTDAQPSEE
jgi:large subunit ribosomal protein L10